MIKAVIFDMDGVLVAAKEWHYEALNRALALFDFSISREQHITQYDGLPTREKLEMLSLEQGLPRELHALINEKKQAYTIDVIHEQCKPNKLHENALSTLKSMGYQLALASNSIRQTIDLMMEKTQLSHYFDKMLSSSDVSRPKPDPEIYNKSIAALGRIPSECLIIEDNINGVRAAQASGAHVFVVQDIEDVNLDNIIARIKQIELPETCDEIC